MDEELTTPCIRKIPGETGLAAGLHSFSGQLQGIMALPDGVLCERAECGADTLLHPQPVNVDFASPPAVSYTEKITSPVNHTPIMV